MLFKNKPLLSFKRSRNLEDMLVKADLVQSRNKQPTFLGNPRKGTYPCLTCGCGSSIIKGKAYVGKTKREIRVRIGEHKRAIDNCDLEKQKYVTPVSKHFKEQGHNSKQLRWMVLQIVDTPSRGGNYNRLLLQKETMWIDKLNTVSPTGLNEVQNYACFF
ncbi:hypothetical protein XELAEV_18019042mg [Xenopus laevis]|uniref:GIY-YIG domain-containing protein n=1 Tax=Xenopus laevis TaxID=8355 RepID=A0A974DE64_XENLA|nr:hypothetical protein XELAEV_18019042mg [Xenopus laevis]